MPPLFRLPTTWPKAEDMRRECGPYQLRAVLRAFGMDAPIRELYASPFYQKRDWSLPWMARGILRRYGIPARLTLWTPRFGFTKKLLRALESGPVIFVINSIQGAGRVHWISAWGYDAAADEFLCYDSQCLMTEGDVGNIRYSAAALQEAIPWYGTSMVGTVAR